MPVKVCGYEKSLGHDAVEAYQAQVARQKELAIEASRAFAERAAREFTKRIGEYNLHVEPEGEGVATLYCDSLVLTAAQEGLGYPPPIVYYIRKQCPVCGEPILSPIVRTLADIGEQLIRDARQYGHNCVREVE